MTEEQLKNNRHTLAHLLAQAVKEHYKDAKLTLGPAIENGFYYDIDFGDTKVSDSELKELQTFMRKNLSKWVEFTHREVSKSEAEQVFSGNEYKLELINEISERGEKITLYSCGGFEDLCRGGHAENPAKEISADSFKLDRVAGAYWHGDEKNKMLTRIYGLAFESKEKLDAYILQQEEAKKRDHRKLGKELELFTIIDEVGAGLPLFYPKGAILRRTIENYITEIQERRDFVPIWIPHITKGKLYEISGHLDKYDAMYSPMVIDDENYYLKPMNCPHFMMLFKSIQHSYRDLPVRYTCTTTNYRYEKSGELSGLTRVRALTQDDCHVFCEAEKIKAEIEVMLEMIGELYDTFGLKDFYVRISLRDSKNKQKYLGTDEVWETAENALREIVKKTGWNYEEAEDEAAFYGPKLDFMFKDAIGRQWQLSTIQLDFNLPERFELEYTNNQSGKSRPVVIHRAMLGSVERFMGIMIEHFAGTFPTWLSPVQVAIVPVNEAHNDYANIIYKSLKEKGVRVEMHAENDSLGKRINGAKAKKVPYVIVIGDKEKDAGVITVETRGEKLQDIKLEDFISKIEKEIKERTLN
ncbi:MAG: threonine--tRNA ligase [bacterium]